MPALLAHLSSTLVNDMQQQKQQATDLCCAARHVGQALHHLAGALQR